MSDPVVFSGDEERPQRICHGCGQTDDHPRLQYTDGVPEADGVTPRTLLFHYDCTPAYVESEHPLGAYAAARKGLRGDDLIKAVAADNKKLMKAYQADLDAPDAGQEG